MPRSRNHRVRGLQKKLTSVIRNRDAPSWAADMSETVHASLKQHAGPSGRVEEAERGRQAYRPSEIPALGWKDIFWRLWEQFNKNRILLVAAGVTFYLLLALFPALAAFVSV